MRAVFKADLSETANKSSLSEWWLDPRTRGPGEHFHEEDHVYYHELGADRLRLELYSQRRLAIDPP